MKTILITIVILGFCIAGIAVKILMKKDGEFVGTCSSNNPLITNDGEKCSYCGASTNEQCKA